MGISKRTLETLIDLVEIKLSCMDVYDRDDSRELAHLERCLGELKAITGQAPDAVWWSCNSRRSPGQAARRTESPAPPLVSVRQP